MEENKLYDDIAQRTGGDIYIGVVGPVRTGKSTFIKRFMETLVIPNIENVYRRERARDNCPARLGRTVMTAEPKFVPEEAVRVEMADGASFAVRLIDCVGYMVPGATGQMENDAPRMVTTPWYDHDIPMTEAAEIGTRKVIAEHSTIGIVVTTDGTITDIPREDYLEAEERVITELQVPGESRSWSCSTPPIPQSDRAQAIQADIMPAMTSTACAVTAWSWTRTPWPPSSRGCSTSSPSELDLFLPPWVDALPSDHPIKNELYAAIRQGAAGMRRIQEVEGAITALGGCEDISERPGHLHRPGHGSGHRRSGAAPQSVLRHLSDQSGFTISDDGDLMSLLTELAGVKKEYDKVSDALQQVRETGYGIVAPGAEEMKLEEPEIVKQGGRYGVRLKASAPSIHMIRADIETEVSPIVGSEKQSEEMVSFLLQEFEGDTAKIWDSNIFGKSFHELVGEDLNAKLKRMPDDARDKFRETLQRVINEGSGGLICIIL